MRHSIFILAVIFSFTQSYAQCSGDVLLTTQADVNAFTCNGLLDGSLIIDDDGTDPIVDLNPIHINGLPFGDVRDTIAGNLIVRNCPSLLDLEGLDGVVRVLGAFRLENNAQLQSTGAFSLLLESAGHLLVRLNPNLVDFNFPNLTFLGGLTIEDCNSLASLNGLSDFSTVHVGVVLRDNDMLSDISSLQVDSDVDIVIIARNPSLTSISGFNNVTEVNTIGIQENNQLVSISGFNSLTEIVSDLVIKDNPLLQSMPSFNTVFSAGNITVENNDQLAVMTGFIDLQVLTGELEITDNLSLITIPTFDILGTVSAIRVLDNLNLPTIQGFNGLNSNTVQTIFIAYNASLLEIDGFYNLDDLANLEVFDNPELATISMLHDLTSLGYLGVNTNPDLVSVDGFQALLSLDQVAVSSNTSLSDCCWLQVPLNAVSGGGSIIINDNDTGCDSEAEVLSSASEITMSCLEDVVFPTWPGTCEQILSFSHPVPSTECGTVSSMSLGIDGPLGTSFIGNVLGQSNSEFTFQNGITTITFIAHNGNSTQTCVTEVTIVDQEAPTWESPNLSATITGECGVDDPDDLFAAALPNAVDNCTPPTPSYFGPVETSLCGGGTQYVYTAQAVDAAFNASEEFVVTVILEDTQGPEFLNVPSAVTINCGDEVPAAPELMAMDACQGYVIDGVSTSYAFINSCDPAGGPAQHQYTYTAIDDCGNTSQEVWTIYVDDTFSFDVGYNLSTCDDSYTINAPDLPNIESYSWSTGSTASTITVTSSGLYYLDMTTTGGCCYQDSVYVTLNNAEVIASATGGQLDCNGNAVQLMGSANIAGSSYQWNGPGGYTSNAQNPMVTVAGSYTLTVTTPAGCMDDTSITVTNDTNAPDVAASSATVDCINTSAMLNATSSTSGLSYSWTGPGGFTGTGASITASAAGTYVVTATAPNGCTNSANATLSSNTALPMASISATNPTLTCTQTTTSLNATPQTSIASYSWTGPGGFIGTAEDITVGNPGIYTLTLTGQNGCVNDVSIEVYQDTSAPQVSATGAEINCTQTQVSLMGSSTTSGVAYAWSGPNGFNSSIQNPVVSEAGAYLLVVTAGNGCTASAIATVTASNDLPQVTANGASIDCNSGTATIQGTSSTPGVTYAWSGPAAYTASTATATVSQAGAYTLTVTADNGCSSSQTVQVLNDTAAPSIALSTMVLDCEAGEIALSYSSDDPNASVQWTGPNGFSSNESSPTITAQGTYTLVLEAANGCSSSESIVISADFDYTASIETTDATAGLGGSATLSITGGTAPFYVTWDTGQSGATVSDLSVGAHSVVVTDGLGCVQTFYFDIDLTIGLEENEVFAQVKIYPVPVSDVLHIELGQEKVETWAVYDASGQMILRSEISSDSELIRVDMQALSKGNYLLVVEGNDSFRSLPFIKQ